MEFVNSIARIVHTSVAIHGGAANKNIGDAFLLVRRQNPRVGYSKDTPVFMLHVCMLSATHRGYHAACEQCAFCVLVPVVNS